MNAYYISIEKLDVIVIAEDRDMAVAMFRDWCNIERDRYIADDEYMDVANIKSNVNEFVGVIDAFFDHPLWQTVGEYLENQ